MTDREHKPSAEAALELLLYAPLGFALEARTLLPTFVERGRNQITMARMIGRFAVRQGQVEATKRLGPVQEQVETVLADLGLTTRPGAGPSAPPTAASTPTTPASPPRPAVTAVPDLEAAEPAELDSDELAIPDYDSLAASQVVPRLRALSDADLEAVRAYEAAGRSRKTILNRIAQLQGA